jgi:hypothetical protein
MQGNFWKIMNIEGMLSASGVRIFTGGAQARTKKKSHGSCRGFSSTRQIHIVKSGKQVIDPDHL